MSFIIIIRRGRHYFKKQVLCFCFSFLGTCQAVQWLKLHASNAGRVSSIPRQRTNVPSLSWSFFLHSVLPVPTPVVMTGEILFCRRLGKSSMCHPWVDSNFENRKVAEWWWLEHKFQFFFTYDSSTLTVWHPWHQKMSPAGINEPSGLPIHVFLKWKIVGGEIRMKVLQIIRVLCVGLIEGRWGCDLRGVQSDNWVMLTGNGLWRKLVRTCVTRLSFRVGSAPGGSQTWGSSSVSLVCVPQVTVSCKR